VLKGLTGKFTPLSQWLAMDCAEIVPPLDTPQVEFQPTGARTDALKICVGEEMTQRLADARIFMIGCGAIGCEMLKNYALMGLACSEKVGCLAMSP
jgi:ubiquitin-activating enzyme E1-like protein 2